MPSKKRKKKKMTPEQKRAFEEKKRLEMEEAKKKKEELFIQVLKDRLAREEKSRTFSYNKLAHQWRQIFREAKTKELKKDMEALSQTFERIFDRKDAIVRHLLQGMAEAEEQYAMAFRSHLQNIDCLIDLQKRRLQALTDDFHAELETIREEFDTERAMMADVHHKEMNDCADILFALEELFQERENDARSEFQSMRDELKNRGLEEKHALRLNLEQKVDDLWQQFRQSLQNYNDSTEERKTAFEALKVKDEKSAREIDLQMRKLQRIADQIAHLRVKMATNARDSEEKNKFLREERERMSAKFQVMKKQMNQIRVQEREKLTKLTLESNAALKELRRQKTKAELVLRMAELCRKLETEEEKVVPFYASSLTPEQLKDVEEAVLEPPTEPLASMMHEYMALENFWKRYNKALLDKLALEKEKQVLKEHNALLRKLLKDYLDGVSVNQEVLDRENTLLVVNDKVDPRLNAAMSDPRVQRFRQPPRVMIEAAHIVNNILP